MVSSVRGVSYLPLGTSDTLYFPIFGLIKTEKLDHPFPEIESNKIRIDTALKRL